MSTHGPQHDEFGTRTSDAHGGATFDEGFNSFAAAHSNAHGKLFDKFSERPGVDRYGERWDEFPWKDMPSLHGEHYDEGYDAPSFDGGEHGQLHDVFRGARVRYMYGGRDVEGIVLDTQKEFAVVESREGDRHEVPLPQVLAYAADQGAPSRPEGRTAEPATVDTSVVSQKPSAPANGGARQEGGSYDDSVVTHVKTATDDADVAKGATEDLDNAGKAKSPTCPSCHKGKGVYQQVLGDNHRYKCASCDHRFGVPIHAEKSLAEALEVVKSLVPLDEVEKKAPGPGRYVVGVNHGGESGHGFSHAPFCRSCAKEFSKTVTAGGGYAHVSELGKGASHPNADQPWCVSCGKRFDGQSHAAAKTFAEAVFDRDADAFADVAKTSDGNPGVAHMTTAKLTEAHSKFSDHYTAARVTGNHERAHFAATVLASVHHELAARGVMADAPDEGATPVTRGLSKGHQPLRNKSAAADTDVEKSVLSDSIKAQTHCGHCGSTSFTSSRGGAFHCHGCDHVFASPNQFKDGSYASKHEKASFLGDIYRGKPKPSRPNYVGKAMDADETATQSQDLASEGANWCKTCQHYCRDARGGKCPTCGHPVGVKKSWMDELDVLKGEEDPDGKVSERLNRTPVGRRFNSGMIYCHDCASKAPPRMGPTRPVYKDGAKCAKCGKGLK